MDGSILKAVGSFLAVDKVSRGTRNYQPDGTERSREEATLTDDPEWAALR